MKEKIKKYWLLIFFILFIFFILLRSHYNAKTCKCYEVVGDEDNFVCYTPDGQLDTKGECVGEKIYKK